MINSLDEVIKECEEVAEANERKIAYYKIQGDKEWLDECEKERLEYIKKRRQLAEWLRELKESRMVLDILGQFLVDTDIDVCCEDLTMTDDYCEKYCDNKKPLCWYRWAKAKAREVNTDENKT